ncbi:mutator type transposase [Tanacetum coccineum]
MATYLYLKLKDIFKDYYLELKGKKSNTTVKIDVNISGDTSGLERQFKRIYICLRDLKDGFRTGQREFLGLDGCFLSGLFPGQILTVVGIDPNKGIYPLAYALVDSKTKEFWKRQFVDEKDMPIITCMEFIREYLMKRNVNVQLVIRKCNRPLTPNVERLFKVILKDIAQIKVDWNGVVAIWNMASNGEQIGVPGSYVHRSYWLITWQDMYRFKVNPVDGPDLWPKSNLSGILIPPKYTPQPGKAKMSLAQRSCKGQRSTNVGSQPTSQTAKMLVKKRAIGSQTLTGSQTASGSQPQPTKNPTRGFQPASSSQPAQTIATDMGSHKRMTKVSCSSNSNPGVLDLVSCSLNSKDQE